jgi:hypothetical protein
MLEDFVETIGYMVSYIVVAIRIYAWRLHFIPL